MTDVLRPARTDEAAALHALALRSKAHWGYDEAFMTACHDELAVPGELLAAGRVVVAEDGPGRLLGFATLDGEPGTERGDERGNEPGTAPGSGGRGELGMLFVDPGAIGRGLGRRLLQHVLAQARTLGFHTLTIDADPNAESFYLAMGARTIGRTPSGSIPGRELPLMEIDVSV